MSMTGKGGREQDPPVGDSVFEEGSSAEAATDTDEVSLGLFEKLKTALGSFFRIFLFLVLFGTVATGGYYLFRMYSGLLGSGVDFKPKASVPTLETERRPRAVSGDMSVLELVFPSGPSGDGFELQQKNVPRTSSVRNLAAVVTEAFLAGPVGRPKGLVPDGVKLKNIYFGRDSILYIDLSDEFRRNFQGNAIQEYMLLKAFHRSLMKNVYQVKGIKLLLEGKEVDSIGGHLRLSGLLDDAVSAPLLEAHER